MLDFCAEFVYNGSCFPENVRFLADGYTVFTHRMEEDLTMKKFASLLLALVMCLCCLTTAALAERAPVAKDALKIGFIFLHAAKPTYDLSFSGRRQGWFHFPAR